MNEWIEAIQQWCRVQPYHSQCSVGPISNRGKGLEILRFVKSVGHFIHTENRTSFALISMILTQISVRAKSGTPVYCYNIFSRAIRGASHRLYSIVGTTDRPGSRGWIWRKNRVVDHIYKITFQSIPQECLLRLFYNTLGRRRSG